MEQQRIKELETLLGNSREAGLRVFARAEKWKQALTEISLKSQDFSIRLMARNALENI